MLCWVSKNKYRDSRCNLPGGVNRQAAYIVRVEDGIGVTVTGVHWPYFHPMIDSFIQFRWRDHPL